MKISSEMMLLRKYFLGILLVCVFLLALFKLPSCAVNYDEITTLHVSALAWSEIGAGSYVNDANPQMYYVLVKLIVGVFHNPELPLRLMSVLMHLVSIVVVYRMGVLLEDINAGMLIAILYAIHPVVFQLGLFIRPYALLVMLSNLCIYFAVRAWQSEKRYCAALVLCCCVAAMLAAMTHYFGLLLFPVCIGVAFFKATRRKFLLALFSMAAVGGWMFLQSQAQAKVHYQEHLWDVSFKIERILYGFWWANAATAVLLVVLAGWGAFISRGKHRFVFVALLLLAPLVSVITPVQTRYLAMFYAVPLIWVMRLITRLLKEKESRFHIPAPLVYVGVGILAVSAIIQIEQLKSWPDNYRTVAANIRLRADEPIVVMGWDGLGIEYYLKPAHLLTDPEWIAARAQCAGSYVLVSSPLSRQITETGTLLYSSEATKVVRYECQQP